MLSISERRACAALGRHRSTQRKIPRGREDEERLTADIVELAQQYGRYGSICSETDCVTLPICFSFKRMKISVVIIYLKENSHNRAVLL